MNYSSSDKLYTFFNIFSHSVKLLIIEGSSKLNMCEMLFGKELLNFFSSLILSEGIFIFV